MFIIIILTSHISTHMYHNHPVLYGYLLLYVQGKQQPPRLVLNLLSKSEQ